jgi:hypothetical protein
MGYDGSVSAMHKDPYENLYAVIEGEKHFTLMPPDVYPFLGINRQYLNAHWQITQKTIDFSKENPEFYVVPDENA